MIDAAEERIFAARATTIEGVLAKLRLAFRGNVGQAWSDRAIADTSHVVFRDGLASSDWYTRLLWGAIDDLAKLGGVDLASMVADGGPNITPPVARAATVEPSAAGVARLSGKNGAGLRNILNERNAELGRLGEPDLTDEERNVVCGRMNALEERLFDTPAATSPDVMTKLLLIAQIVEEGFEPAQELATKALAEARKLGLAEPAQPWVDAA
ncbi:MULTISPECIES: hypothetical protein [Sphingomonas]|uniref:Uncharacterized protein n=1 Tax=Sphingomonas molluscorum TaxID=418184 RepID=A0ABU8Q334_9SPHN|nr:hypothetical protein [Sphingomonas sp. JUb134]MBM7405670.1 hypothetical protein [Sphingomonas sp. JUb134]